MVLSLSLLPPPPPRSEVGLPKGSGGGRACHNLSGYQDSPGKPKTNSKEAQENLSKINDWVVMDWIVSVGYRRAA